MARACEYCQRMPHGMSLPRDFSSADSIVPRVQVLSATLHSRPTSQAAWARIVLLWRENGPGNVTGTQQAL